MTTEQSINDNRAKVSMTTALGDNASEETMTECP